LPDDRKAFLVRIDPKLHGKLQQWARDEFRSLNAHVEYLLKEALRRAGRLKKEGGAENRGRFSS